MTHLMEKAWAKIQKLPSTEQDVIAWLILEEIVDERRWEEALARSQDQLARLADKVRAEIAAGRVKEAGMDDL